MLEIIIVFTLVIFRLSICFKAVKKVFINLGETFFKLVSSLY